MTDEIDGQMLGTDRRPSLLFLIPAHNEELLIEETVRSLLAMTTRLCDYSVTVLADACTDATVSHAQRAGANVFELGGRHPIGKSRLLEHAVQLALHEPHDAVVIVDADSTVAADLADVLSRNPYLREIVQQGYHTLANPTDSWLTRLAALFARARYEWQLRLHARAGLNAPLTGNGMCIGSHVLRVHGLRCQTIKEDLELFAQYTLAGVRIVLQTEARVYAQESRTLRHARTQRVRWEAGKWGILRRYGLALARSKLPLRQRLDALAEVSHHGPTMHALAAVALGAPLVILTSGPGRWLGVLLLSTTVPLLTYSMLALAQEKQKLRLCAAIGLLPVYVCWRLGILALGLQSRAAKRWIRSPRHSRR